MWLSTMRRAHRCNPRLVKLSAAMRAVGAAREKRGAAPPQAVRSVTSWSTCYASVTPCAIFVNHSQEVVMNYERSECDLSSTTPTDDGAHQERCKRVLGLALIVTELKERWFKDVLILETYQSAGLCHFNLYVHFCLFFPSPSLSAP